MSDWSSVPVSQVAVEGVRFQVHRTDPPQSGRHTPVLLLHGVPETARCWADVVAELRTDRTVIAPDLKGLGGSEVAGPYDIPTLVRELAALVLHEVDGPVDVVGHDWGGALAIALAAARPELVRRLVVANAPYRYVNYVRAAHIPFFGLPVLPEALFAVGGKALVRQMITKIWKAPTPIDPDALAEYEQAYSDPARVQAMLGYYRGAVRDRLRRIVRHRGGDGAPPTTVRAEKVLVIWGALDPVLPLPVGEAAVRDLGPDTVMVTVPEAGHFVIEEAPHVVVPAIADFVRG